MNHLKQKAKGSALFTVLSAVVITVSVLFLLVKLAGSGYHIDVADATATATETRIMPSGSVTEGDGVPVGERSGESIFNKICIQCHAEDSSTPNAPRINNNADWIPRIAKGFDTLVSNAINGFANGAMPARGGAADLTDEEVARAVAYMANNSGANFSAPEAGAATADDTAATETAAANSSVDLAAAKAEFDKVCFACHNANSTIPGAPRLGNKDDWTKRIAQGKDTVFKHAIEGFNNVGFMPPKGGAGHLSDDEIKAIVVYMVNESGGNF